jgi:mRNA-degrading endonuclease RelE of RelBE toxin-antitoxin system
LSCKLKFEKPAEKAISSLPEMVSKRIHKRLEELAQEPSCEERLKGKLKNLCKMRIGNYRVIYYLLPCTVIIIRIGKRESFYEKL